MCIMVTLIVVVQVLLGVLQSSRRRVADIHCFATRLVSWFDKYYMS